MKNEELFADPTHILDINEPFFEFGTTSQKSSKNYPDSDKSKSHGLTPLSDIPDLVGDKKYYEEDDINSEDENACI